MVTRLSVAHQRTAQKLMSKRPTDHHLWAQRADSGPPAFCSQGIANCCLCHMTSKTNVSDNIRRTWILSHYLKLHTFFCKTF